MNGIIETCFSLRDDQVRKRAGTYARLGLAAAVFFLVFALLIVVRFGLSPEPIQTRMAQISDRLIQHANATSAEPGTVMQTGDTIFLRRMESFLTNLPFLLGVLLFALALAFIQCGLMFQKIKMKIGESPATESSATSG